MSPFPVGPDQIWYEVRHRPAPGTRALFLDRDGVIIRDRHYLRDPDGVELLDGIVAIMRAAQRSGVPCIVVTNQSGIGRGLFGWPEFYAVQERMLEDLARAGVTPAALLACTHHPEAKAAYRLADPPMRKPNPGMILRAAESLGLSAAESLMIGDKGDDMAAAAAAGLSGGILVGPGEA
ncbi:D-glycero-alpha-D-manno-heptose-1,7-bisphosphate 7-phosphatase, partial [Methylobacterium trifolii]